MGGRVINNHTDSNLNSLQPALIQMFRLVEYYIVSDLFIKYAVGSQGFRNSDQ